MWMQNSCLIFRLSQGNSSKSRITIQCEGPLKKPLLHSLPIVWPSTPCQSIFSFCERSIIPLIPNTEAQRSPTLSHHPTSCPYTTRRYSAFPPILLGFHWALIQFLMRNVIHVKGNSNSEKTRRRSRIYSPSLKYRWVKISFPHQKMLQVGTGILGIMGFF